MLPIFVQARTEVQSRPAVVGSSRPAWPAPVDPGDIINIKKPAAGLVRIYLIRHGESVGNTRPDDPKLTESEKDKLTERGRGQASAVGAALKHLALEEILHSPAVRASETAGLLAKAAGGDVAPVCTAAPDFGQIVIGKSPKPGTSGLRYLVESWRVGRDPRLEGGESLEDVAKRVKAGLARIATNAKSGRPFVIVAHGEVLAAACAQFDISNTTAALTEWRIANTGILALDVSKDGSIQVAGYYAPQGPASRNAPK